MLGYKRPNERHYSYALPATAAKENPLDPPSEITKASQFQRVAIERTDANAATVIAETELEQRLGQQEIGVADHHPFSLRWNPWLVLLSKLQASVSIC